MRTTRPVCTAMTVLLAAGVVVAQQEGSSPRVYSPRIVAADAEWTIHVEGEDGQPLASQTFAATIGSGDAAHTIEVTADERGTVKMPRVRAGPCFRWVTLAVRGKPVFRRPVTVLPAPSPTTPPTINWTPDTFSPSGPTRVIGTGVHKLDDWEIVPDAGGPQPLTPLAGSPYEQVLGTPPGLPDSEYRIRARDDAGNPVYSPTATWPVSLTLRGEARVREGTGGRLIVTANRDTWVHLESAPGIQLAHNDCYVRADAPTEVPFKAPVRGKFTVRAEARDSPEGGRTRGKAPKVTVSLPERPDVQYDEKTDSTVVRQFVSIQTGRRGPTLGDAKALVVASRQGAQRTIDTEIVALSLTGTGTAVFELPGRARPEDIGIHVVDLGIPDAPTVGLPEVLTTPGDEPCLPATTSVRKAGDATATIKSGTIRLKYEPEKAPCCTKLVWIQVMRELLDGKPVKPSEIGDGYMDKDTTDDGYHVDYKNGEKDPYYNGDDAADKVAGTEPGNTTEPKGSGMSDTPNLPSVPAGAKKVVWEFESWAFCAEGPCKGTYYKGRKWTYTKEKGKPGEVKDGGDAGAEPSKGFKDGLDKWSKNHGFDLPKK
ncbi:MAG: hypothetical protein ACE5O2_02275 [Armatimonadota bacterium]